MTQQEPRIVRFGDGFSYSDTATRRLFGDSASVDVLENFDRCLEAACADGSTVAVVPVHNTENGDITGTGGVPLADMARSMGLRVLSTLELPVDHVLASFGSLEEIKIVYSKDVALGQCSKFIERYGMRSASIVPGKSVPLSTAGAAIYVAGKRVRVIAAICSEEAPTRVSPRALQGPRGAQVAGSSALSRPGMPESPRRARPPAQTPPYQTSPRAWPAPGGAGGRSLRIYGRSGLRVPARIRQAARSAGPP